jgi:hypothetical protein
MANKWLPNQMAIKFWGDKRKRQGNMTREVDYIYQHVFRERGHM